MLAFRLRFLGICALGWLALAAQGHAEEAARGWKVDRSSGEVWVVTAGTQNIALTRETGLRDGDSIRTGSNGRVLLRRGQETILIASNSVVGLPAETKAGSTTVIQQAGSILLEVNKRDARTFEVETPYLVAAVKGTQFRVNVGAKGAGVNVQHGSVEVADVKSGKFALVLPGQTASVSAIGNGGLTLGGIGTLSPIQNGTPRPSSIGRVPVPRGGLTAPASIRASLQSTAPRTALANAGGLRIAAPIGQVRLDVHAATRGLARDAGLSAPARSAATIWNGGGNTPPGSTASNTTIASPALGSSVSPAINNSRASVAAAAADGTGHASIHSGRTGNGYAYGPGGNAHGANPGNGLASGSGNDNGHGRGNGNGNNGNGNGNGGGNGSNAGGNGNNGHAFGIGNGHGGGNGHGNNGNGNGNGGSNRTGR